MPGPVFRRAISSHSQFEDEIGYSRAIVSGEFVFVSGTTGYDYENHHLPERVEDQCVQALSNVEKALKEAGASWRDVVRVTYMLPDREEFERCHPILRKTFGSARPAATYIQVGLSEERMKIEIEVTALASRWYNTIGFAFIMVGIMFVVPMKIVILMSPIALYLIMYR